MLRSFAVFLICLTICHFSKAQNSFPQDQELLNKFAAFNRNNPKDLLFVHTDKHIYTNGEQLWFSAYLVESLSAKPEEHNILSVTLVREDNRKLHFQEKYAMENGLAFGSFFLHDTLPPGNYQVLFSTNVLDKNYRPIAQFSQEIIVKSITQVSFNARLSMLDSLPVNGEVRVDVGVEFTGEDSHLHIQPEVSYNVGSGKIRTKKLNKKNKGVLSIPVEELSQPNPVLLVSITCKNEVQHLSLKLPEIKLQGLSVGFFPEGGYLIEGLSNVVGWESRTAANLPVALTGILYRDDQVIDTVLTNSYGIGSFRIMPEQGSKYSLRIEKNSHITSDTSFQLPVALREGVVLQLEEGVVNDTLAISLSSVINQKVKVFVHDYRDGYSSFYQQVQPSAKRVLVALPAVPRGLTTITVLDEMGRPLAERLFFAHFNQRTKLMVNGSKDVAKKREEVTVKLKLADEKGNPLAGIVSVACIQEGRLDDFRQRDIESYSLLEAKMQQLPTNPLDRRIEDKAYLENILLVRGWRRYSWQQMVDTPVTRDTLAQTQTLDIKGKVLFNDRDLKKAVPVNIMRDGQFDFLQTEPNGDFNFQREHLITKVGRKVFAVVGTKNTEAYSVRMIDPYREVNEQQARETEIRRYGLLAREQSTQDFKMKGLDNTIALKEFVLKSKKVDPTAERPTYNACGDYVCMFNILNCSNHFGHYNNTVPVKGHRYAEGRVYFGCIIYEHEVRSIRNVDGIYTTREFYGVDPKLFDFPDPQQLSTLYWKPGLVINKDGEAECSFYTGDITGKFRVVVQGVGSKELIYGQGSFEVR